MNPKSPKRTGIAGLPDLAAVTMKMDSVITKSANVYKSRTWAVLFQLTDHFYLVPRYQLKWRIVRKNEHERIRKYLDKTKSDKHAPPLPTKGKGKK